MAVTEKQLVQQQGGSVSAGFDKCVRDDDTLYMVAGAEVVRDVRTRPTVEQCGDCEERYDEREMTSETELGLKEEGEELEAPEMAVEEEVHSGGESEVSVCGEELNT